MHRAFVKTMPRACTNTCTHTTSARAEWEITYLYLMALVTLIIRRRSTSLYNNIRGLNGYSNGEVPAAVPSPTTRIVR